MTVAGKLDDLISECREGRIDRIVALPQSANERVAGIVKKFDHASGVDPRRHPHRLRSRGQSDIAHKVSNLGPVGLLDVKKKP